MEFVIVTCDNAVRTVFIDNQGQGVTGSRLSVPEGLHVFDLGAPLDYEPPFLEVLVENTTAPDPMLIPFSLIAAREPVARERAAKPAVKRARKRAPAKASRMKAGSKTRAAKKKADKMKAGKMKAGEKKSGRTAGRKPTATRRAAKTRAAAGGKSKKR